MSLSRALLLVAPRAQAAGQFASSALQPWVPWWGGGEGWRGRVVCVRLRELGHLSAELLELPAGVQLGLLCRLQAGPQLASLLLGCGSGLLQDQQLLLLFFLGPLKTEQSIIG